MQTVEWNEAERVVVRIDQRRLPQALVRDGDTIMHHCNTRALATVDHSTVSRTETGILRPPFPASLPHALEEACSP